MYTLPASPEALERLRAEREDADRRYNAALTALDAAVQALMRLRGFPGPPPPPDDSQLSLVNELREVVPPGGAPAVGGFLKRQFAALAWRLVGPLWARQQSFNAAVVEHLNREIPDRQRIRESIDVLLAVLREQREALADLHGRLVLYLQEITPYVDTKDRELTGLAAPLAAGLSDLGERLARQAENVAVAHHLGMAAKREVDRLALSGTSPVGTPAGLVSPAKARPGSQAVAATRLDPVTYVGFEDRFRGSRDAIRAHQAGYVQFFAGASDVLDLGCGRGEFLDLLREQGIGARGLDANHEMVEVCRARGLDVTEGDGLGHLRSLPDASLGGLFAAQVIEHLTTGDLVALLGCAHDKLRPGACLVLETINPTCWTAFFESYIRDPTHVRPVHPETLSYLATAAGFQDASIRFSSPIPEEVRLRHVEGNDQAARACNENVDRLNALLFGFMDYAVVARRA